MIGHKIVTKIVDQRLAEIEIGVLILAGRSQYHLQDTAKIGRDLTQNRLESAPGFGGIQAPAAELDGVDRDKGRRLGVLVFEVKQFAEAFAVCVRKRYHKLRENAFRQTGQAGAQGF